MAMRLAMLQLMKKKVHATMNPFWHMSVSDDEEETYEHILPDGIVNTNNNDAEEDEDWLTLETDGVQQDHLHTGESDGTHHHGPASDQEDEVPNEIVQQQQEEDAKQEDPAPNVEELQPDVEEGQPTAEQQEEEGFQAVQHAAQPVQAENNEEGNEDDDGSDSNPWLDYGITVRARIGPS